jgi:hypothetical protein
LLADTLPAASIAFRTNVGGDGGDGGYRGATS